MSTDRQLADESSRPKGPVYTGTGHPVGPVETLTDDTSNQNIGSTISLVSNTHSVPSPGTNHGCFGYEEFFGGYMECPTCHGSGKISRDLEHELVALIPMSDKRLRPRRTVLYVLIAIVVCVLIGGLLLFFLFPRSVTIKSLGPVLTPTYINTTEPEKLSMTVVNYYNITNKNFFSVEVSSLEVKMLFYGEKIMATNTNDTKLTVPMKSSRQHYVALNATFTDKYIVESCRTTKGRILIMKFQATATFFYYDKTEESTLSTFQ